MKSDPKKILIVEDDMIISMVLKKMVERLDHTVIDMLITGEEAISSIKENEPDLILMDIQLKDSIDGIQVMEEARKTTDVPVIYITGNSEQHNIRRARETNFVEYLIKPIEMKVLKQSIKKAFQ